MSEKITIKIDIVFLSLMAIAAVAVISAEVGLIPVSWGAPGMAASTIAAVLWAYKHPPPMIIS